MTLKTYGGLALASIKTINGLATASVKTVNGLSIAPPVYGSGAVNPTVLSFPSDTANIRVASSTLNPGTSDFTMESHIYDTQSTGFNLLFANNNASGFSGGMYLFGVNRTTANQFRALSGSSGQDNTAGPPPTVQNFWRFFAVCRSGTTVKIFVDGVLKTTSAASWFDNFNLSGTQIGGHWSSETPSFQGYMEEIRVTIGVARYSATYTPQTAPFPDSLAAGDADFASVKLLIHGPAITDVIGNTITSNGTVTTGTPP
jgi:hypothetical protein